MACLGSALLHVPAGGVGNSTLGAPTLQSFFTANEVEESLEASARCLSQANSATEVLLEWLKELRSSPQQKYLESPTGDRRIANSIGNEVAFRQIFLRSEALELTIESVMRTLDLKRHLQAPDLFSESVSEEPVNFSQAFVTLLSATLGPSEIWLPVVKALLDLDVGLVDEPCHGWMVHLIAGLKSPWIDDAPLEHGTEVEVAEEEARRQKTIAEQVFAEPPSLETVSPAFDNLCQWSVAASAAYKAWSLRRDLILKLVDAASFQTSRAKNGNASEHSASSVVAAASERVAALEAESSKLSLNMEDVHASFGDKISELRQKVEVAASASQEVRCEIEEAESTRKELLKQVRTVSENLDEWRIRLSERVEQENTLRSELQQLEKAFSEELSTLGKAQQSAERARGATVIVKDLAIDLVPQAKSNMLHEDAETDRQKKKKQEQELALAEQEISRLCLAAQILEVCVRQAEEEEEGQGQSKPQLAKGEIGKLVSGTFCEIDRHSSNVELLAQSLRLLSAETTLDKESSQSDAHAASERARELQRRLQECSSRCDEMRRKAETHMSPALHTLISSDPALPTSTSPALRISKSVAASSYHSGNAQAPVHDLQATLSSALRPAFEGRPSFLDSALVPSRDALAFSSLSSLLTARSLSSSPTGVLANRDAIINEGGVRSDPLPIAEVNVFEASQHTAPSLLTARSLSSSSAGVQLTRFENASNFHTTTIVGASSSSDSPPMVQQEHVYESRDDVVTTIPPTQIVEQVANHE